MRTTNFLSRAIVGCALLVDRTHGSPLARFGQALWDTHPKAQRGPVLSKLPERHESDKRASTDGFRFFSRETSQYQVTSLPGVPFSVGEFYSGLIPINQADTSRQLFFAFQPTVGPRVDELTIWLNGGPGCTSLEGLFQENGLFVWREGTPAPALNPYSWVNMTNMLWVEQPVGTGYTQGIPSATSEEEIAADFVGFLENFQKAFGIKNFKIYVTGESYAGRYVPYISSAIIDKNDKVNFDLKGAMVYDPCIGQYDYVQEQVPTYDFIKSNPEFFPFSKSFMAELESMHNSCGYKDFIDKYMQFPPSGLQPAVASDFGCDIFNTAVNQAQALNSCFNIYEVNQTCPKPFDPMTDNSFPTSSGAKTNYFNRDDVKAALHAPSNVQWVECSNRPVFTGYGGPESQGDYSLDPIQKVLPKVIESTNRVLVANGDYDMIIITNGTLLSIQNMTWNGQLGFQTQPGTPINIDGQGQMGVQHFERGLMWGQTFKSGHMGPEYQPRVSLKHLEWLLGRIDSL